jgi:hypothetical protein
MGNYAYPIDSDVTETNGTVSYDRAVNSAEYRKIRKRTLSNGVYTGMNVVADSGMTVVVNSGAVEIEGACRNFDTNTTLALQSADSHYQRIDTVVARLDLSHSVRNINLYVKMGVPATTPIAPELTRTSTIYEIGLANILIPTSSTSVSQERITDTRLDTSRCGLVHALNDFDSSALYNQISADMTSFKTTEQANFNTWFESIQETLDENTAGHLLNLIQAIPLQMHPVGELYPTLNANFNPNTAWGGTWELIEEGQVLLSAGSNYTAGNSYGSNTHAITTNEMPSHSHNEYLHSTQDEGGTTYTYGLALNSNYFAEKLVAHQKGGNFNDHYTSHVGGSNPMSLMQKSIAVYIWKRTA